MAERETKGEKSPMTYEQSAELMIDVAFRGRIKVAVLKFANYVLDEPGNVTAHNARHRWAVGAMQQPDTVAAQVQAPVVMDGAVQSAGAAITDSALQSSVETILNKLM